MNTTTDITWRRLRELVRNRDKSICFYCNKEDENGACDHILPISKGGTDSILNLVWSCKSCNSSKGNRVNNDDYIDNVTLLTENEEKPNFRAIFSDLITLTIKVIIPPYPRFMTPAPFWDYDHYRETLMSMESHIITTWIRERLWTTPPEVKNILQMERNQQKFSTQFSASLEWSQRRYPTCPKCGDAAAIMWRRYSRWLCINMHAYMKVVKSGQVTYEIDPSFADYEEIV